MPLYNDVGYSVDMPNFEYTILDITSEQDIDGHTVWNEPSLADLNELASDGWRLVATFPRVSMLGPGNPYSFRGFVLERQKP